MKRQYISHEVILEDTVQFKEYRGYFFEKDAMRFFKSRLGKAWLHRGVVYFITSEQNDDSARMYTVRSLAQGDARLFESNTVLVKNASKFQEFTTTAQATRFVYKLLEASGGALK